MDEEKKGAVRIDMVFFLKLVSVMFKMFKNWVRKYLNSIGE